MANDKPGKDSSLTEELTLAIRKLYLSGKTYIEIQQELDINENNWDWWYWKDYQGFRTFLNKIKAERFIRRTEKLSDELLELPAVDEEGKVSEGILRVKQKEMEFLRETLGKDNYSKRSELTGKDGEQVGLGVVILPAKNNEESNIQDETKAISTYEDLLDRVND
ncbi:hypothetical protein E6Q11_04350 [Candidatus Dojkabacteria bacterium]|uniref:Uncharacterized protein n=1 Tax=Candidatus Dojkabacteria bacterium TaxID=2099670 RepID=A0A5C7J502_9BACT|nr:MAG: hypothetical protein E6Q11_04350 [Candidatus Dojkabacteria bacterium]